QKEVKREERKEKRNGRFLPERQKSTFIPHSSFLIHHSFAHRANVVSRETLIFYLYNILYLLYSQ
ncbi:MAG: hypothetical protein J6S77_06900, partial [Clostridia bacterium]|nr:hypothetical protein [Clostridia bacterium]